MKRRDFLAAGSAGLAVLATATTASALQAGNESVVPGGRIRVDQHMPITTPFTPAQSPDTLMYHPRAQQIPDSDPNRLRFERAMLELPRHNYIELPAAERAVLMSLQTEQRDINGNIIRDAFGNPVIVPVRQGMNVFEGQVLGHFDDRELQAILRINQAQLEVAEAERDKVIEKEHARRAMEVARLEFLRMEAANRRHEGIFTEIDVDKARLAFAQAEAQYELQIYTLEEVRTREVSIRESEMARTAVQIELRKLVAPIGGIIVGIHAAEGEWKREGDPILEIMNLETMWVKVWVSANRYTTSDVYGKQASIRVALANGRTEMFQGTVVFCNPRIAPGGEFDISIEVQNRRADDHWLLQPGRTGVDIVIAL